MPNGGIGTVALLRALVAAVHGFGRVVNTAVGITHVASSKRAGVIANELCASITKTKVWLKTKCLFALSEATRTSCLIG